MNIAKKLVDALKSKKQPSAYDAQAEVRRIEGGTAWVRIAGGTTETPVQMSIDAKPGDTVKVRLSGGKAWITGNNTAPPTDDRTALQVGDALYRLRKQTKAAEKGIWEGIEVADERAIEAQRSADGKNTIFYTQAAPTEGMKTDDTWFNPNEDNAIYRYNGTTWVKQELGEDAIHDLSITNAKIANTTIQSGKIANLDVAKLTGGKIATAHLDVPGIITAGNIATEDDLPTKLSDLTNDEGFITNADISGKANTSDAVAEEQTIYKSAVSGTTSMLKTETWITATDEPVTGEAPNATAGQTPHWTTKRPKYQSNYPVIFVAKQTRTVAQKAAGDNCTCTTPLMDDSVTIIDGGHITTGTIDAGRISPGEFTMTGGSISIETSSDTESKIQLEYENPSSHDTYMNMMQAGNNYLLYADKSGHEQTSARLSPATGLNISVIDDRYMTFPEKRGISAMPGFSSATNPKPSISVYSCNSSGTINESTDIEPGEISINGTSIFELVYPVGAIYISTVSTDPGTLFGGTWQRIQDTFLLAAGSTYSAGATGGSADAVVPYHRHSVSKVTGGISGGSHSHVALKWLADKVASGSAFPRIFRQSNTTSGTTPENTSSETHTHDLPAHNTDYAGTSGNATGANMPPYLAVYVWKRTA